MTEYRFHALEGYPPVDDAQQIERARDFADLMGTRRTVRDYDSRPVPREVIEHCLRAASAAPSGANQQPWHFVAVADPAVRHAIRLAAEDEEQHFYTHRAPDEWLEALAPLGTDANKSFLDKAPWLIAIFVKRHGHAPDGSRIKHYYPGESVGIATGLLIAALHHAGLATLTHTPSPMKFLNRILDRPANERPFLLLVTGHPASGARVPDIRRKTLAEVANFL